MKMKSTLRGLSEDASSPIVYLGPDGTPIEKKDIVKEKSQSKFKPLFKFLKSKSERKSKVEMKETVANEFEDEDEEMMKKCAEKRLEKKNVLQGKNILKERLFSEENNVLGERSGVDEKSEGERQASEERISPNKFDQNSKKTKDKFDGGVRNDLCLSIEATGKEINFLYKREDSLRSINDDDGRRENKTKLCESFNAQIQVLGEKPLTDKFLMSGKYLNKNKNVEDISTKTLNSIANDSFNQTKAYRFKSTDCLEEVGCGSVRKYTFSAEDQIYKNISLKRKRRLDLLRTDCIQNKVYKQHKREDEKLKEQLTKEQLRKQLTREQLAKEKRKKQLTKEQLKQHLAKEQLKEQLAKEQLKEQLAKEHLKEQLTKDYPLEEQLVTVPKDHSHKQHPQTKEPTTSIEKNTYDTKMHTDNLNKHSTKKQSLAANQQCFGSNHLKDLLPMESERFIDSCEMTLNKGDYEIMYQVLPSASDTLFSEGSCSSKFNCGDYDVETEVAQERTINFWEKYPKTKTKNVQANWCEKDEGSPKKMKVDEGKLWLKN